MAAREQVDIALGEVVTRVREIAGGGAR
jgi:hypothetical protein